MKFCPLYSGSSGNSIFVASDKSRILIDAGLSGKTIEAGLKSIEETCEKIDGIFITHEHSDHIKGVGILSRKYDIPIYANELTWKAMDTKIGKVKEHNIKIMDGSYVEVGDLQIVSHGISHDAADPVGYSVYSKEKKATIATDLGYFSEDVKKAVYDADIVLLESNHDIEMVKFGPYPYPLKKRILSEVGHLSNDACGKAIVEIMNDKPKHIVLGHLSKTNNYPDLAYKTVENILVEEGINIGKEIYLTMAERDKPSKYIEL
ncbi:Phosphoribosyl 1,2-cyclic phosphodiesterase [Clostridium collagenovorans DSM 3089]|uniref:Phosphoribosyl 1,2-cyclic phosphodiesterase n=1 Tax=Clostridium collagenovorans DSM 3089 TaxID=1121306 RepID=A0A1M5X920_9CLOT|nr:MBL fold metallo-hydrolase [Clostridium collagenovorans]SHH96078.1 Phosphoribosyl 1,2-cyclic phosphodiesterase [Clostridium collagenovorans DSM 3089]